MKPNNAGKDRWLHAKTGKEKFKQHAQRQDAVLCKLLYVKDDKVKYCISTIIRFMGRGGGIQAPGLARFL